LTALLPDLQPPAGDISVAPFGSGTPARRLKFL
jgi:hypothetical protein